MIRGLLTMFFTLIGFILYFTSSHGWLKDAIWYLGAETTIIFTIAWLIEKGIRG